LEGRQRQLQKLNQIPDSAGALSLQKLNQLPRAKDPRLPRQKYNLCDNKYKSNNLKLLGKLIKGGGF